MATAFTKTTLGGKHVTEVSTTSVDSIPPLGEPGGEKRFFWQRRGDYDPNSIATQPSVFDSPDTSEKYQPPANWENIHRFDPLARWTWAEEYKLIRKIDGHIMVWACIMFMALELDRSNLSQANSDNILGDLNMTTNDYNLGTTVRLLAFLLAEVPSQLVSKWVGPDRWIPTQMVLWSFVAGGQFWLSGRRSFLVCHALLGIIQGGFIPDVILYLSYFYKHHELSIRLSWFWGMMTVSDIIASFLAYGILHMAGVRGHAGWRWMFLIEGLITLVVGLFAFVLMPAGPCQTASWFRGKKGWFNPREETIIVNRVLREDPSKSGMHNREPVTPSLLLRSLADYDLWPLYIIGLLFEIPTEPVSYYLTLSLRGLGFDTFQTNLLTIPSSVLSILTQFALTYLSEVWGELSYTSMLGQIWCFPFLIWLRVAYTAESNRWVVYAILTLLLGQPSSHPIQVAWNSRNSNAVRLRTVSAAMYNMMDQVGGIVSANIYREDDAPIYRRGNTVLLSILSLNVVVYCATKYYYIMRNRQRDRKWNAMSEEEQLAYLATATDQGNKRLDFRFHH